MLILIDLDGTLINTVHPTWKPYKDGQDGFNIEPHLAQIPVFNGAKEFLISRKAKGDNVVVVSDSHFRYVNPICKMLDVECISLADKPNTSKLYQYLESHPDYKQELDNGDCFVIGDTRLDVEFGRQIGAMTIWFLPYQITEEIKDERDGIGDKMLSMKYGPTFAAKKFDEMERIIDAPLSNLYSIEATFANSTSYRAIRLNDNRYGDGSYACIRCLARQEQGACDKYARADKYYIMSNPQRTQEFIRTLAEGISNYINQPSLIAQGWDYFTYLTDKSSTTPPNKMREIFDLVQTSVPKIQLLKWAGNVHGSLREQNMYSDRQAFLQDFLSVECPTETSIDIFGQERQTELSLSGRNIIVLDDQLTTAATAWHVIRKLKEKGARNVLFIAMFQMTLSVNNGVTCPRCGKPMLIKIRRTDGHRFYSCIPPQYRGDGCGYILDTEGNLDDKKFVEIQQKYKYAYDIFKTGRNSSPDFKQLVINSEADIELIDKMGWFGNSVSDDNILHMRELYRKAEKEIYSNSKRKKYYGDFTYLHSDYYDSELALLEYSLEHLEELDAYIDSIK